MVAITRNRNETIAKSLVLMDNLANACMIPGRNEKRCNQVATISANAFLRMHSSSIRIEPGQACQLRLSRRPGIGLPSLTASTTADQFDAELAELRYAAETAPGPAAHLPSIWVSPQIEIACPEIVLPRGLHMKRIWSASWSGVTYSLIEV